jgi:hypothetical protein
MTILLRSLILHHTIHHSLPHTALSPHRHLHHLLVGPTQSSLYGDDDEIDLLGGFFSNQQEEENEDDGEEMMGSESFPGWISSNSNQQRGAKRRKRLHACLKFR